MHPLLDRVFRSRGIQSKADLELGLGKLLSPESMLDLKKAAARVADAIEQQQKILVVGDYDADGATSSALVVLALRAMGAVNADFLVPNRFDYGYGLTPEIVAVAAQSLPDLLITVDNGIASLDGVDEANAHGIDVVVTDHHLPGEGVPAAVAMVNPNQHGCAFADKALAGVGVAFYLMVSTRATLRDRGWFERQGIAIPQMADYLDLVALGTVADLVPLSANNRILVEHGLKRIRAGRCRPGIAALVEASGRDRARLVSSDIGFALGPRLNAAGRLDDISLGIQCLISDDPIVAREIAMELDALNRARRDIETGMQEQALAACAEIEAAGDEELPWGVCLYRDDWHQGLVGLVASRIKERYHRPVIAFAPGDSGQLKGSARSIPGLHLRDVLARIDALHPGLIRRFGGHAMAAGLTLDESAYPDFCVVFDQVVRQLIDDDALHRVYESDGVVPPDDLVMDRAEQLRTVSPWGQAFPEPVFDGVFTFVSRRVVGDKHLKMVLAPIESPERQIDAIAFNAEIARWTSADIKQVHCVYRLDVNTYRGVSSLQLLVDALFAVDEVVLL